jgi:uncharacterized membrane-anchored protein
VNAARRTGGDDTEPSGFALFVAAHHTLIEWVAVIIGTGILPIGPPLALGAILLLILAIVVVVVAIEFISAAAYTNT